MSVDTMRRRLETVKALRDRLQALPEDVDAETRQHVTDGYNDAWADLHSHAEADLDAAKDLVVCMLVVRSSLARLRAADDQLSPEQFEAAQNAGSDAWAAFVDKLGAFESMP